MIVNYKSRKKDVLDAYNKLEELVSELQKYAKIIQLPDPMASMSNLMEEIRGKAERVKADRFIIIVAGASKSGKSLFINAYLGVDLLPVDVKQCTSSIIEIKTGELFSARATYADGRIIEFSGEKKVRDFLKENAALDDDYRDIPVPTINIEILVKAGLRAMNKGRRISISNADVDAMLESPEVKAANIHNIPNYNDKIREYIKVRKDNWKNIVTKIEVLYPFSEDLRGIEIIDSPGVCARGGVAGITEEYIRYADAVIFLKPITGQALESQEFNQFMDNVSVARNKNALFLALTHIAEKNEEDIRRLEEEANKIFSSKLDENHILLVDSKAEFYAKKYQGVENIEDEVDKLKKEGKCDNFLYLAYLETKDKGDSAFIEKLQEISRFERVYNSLDMFGRKAHYLTWASLLDSISNVYEKLESDMHLRIEMFKNKLEDPNELAKKIAEGKQELDNLQNKLSRGVDLVVRRFLGDEGIIKNKAEGAVQEFLASVREINPQSEEAFKKLEQASWEKIDLFKRVMKEVQRQVLEDFDKELIALSDKGSIPFKSLKPNFTDATFKEIKKSTKAKATETESYEEGITFTEVHTRSVYMQNKHFELVKNNILNRLHILKNDLMENLWEFVDNIRSRYIKELSQNINIKKRELDAIEEARTTAEQALTIISELNSQSKIIDIDKTLVKQLKGGIDKYV